MSFENIGGIVRGSLEKETIMFLWVVFSFIGIVIMGRRYGKRQN